MSEEERLTLVSEVEDEFTEPLERMENALDNIDDEIRDTGRGRDHVEVHIEATGVGRTLQKLEGLERTLDRIDDADVDIGNGIDGGVVPDMDAGSGSQQQAVTSGGRNSDLFTVENVNLFRDEVAPFLDTEEFGRRGGEVSRIEDVLSKDIDDVVDFDAAFKRALDDDSDVDLDTLKGIKGIDGPEAFSEAAETLSAEGLTDLGEGQLTRRQRLSNLREKLVFTMGKFHQIIASLLPLAGLLVGALPAAITGITALGGAALAAAGALGAIGALGAMGMNLEANGEMGLEALAEQFDQIGQSFADAFAPLARSLAPTLETALTSIEMMAGPLADASSGLLAFRDEFIGVANFIEKALPSLVSDVIAFGHAVTPIIQGIVQEIGQRDVLGFLATQLQSVLPSLVVLFSVVMDLIPAVIRLSAGFLDMTAILGAMLQPLFVLMNTFPVLTRGLGILLGAFLLATSVITLFSVVTTGASGIILGKLVPAVSSAIASLTGYTLTTWQAYTATVALIGAVSLGVGAIASMSGAFNLFGKNVTGARKELEKFNRTGNALGSTSIRGSGGQNPYATTAGGSTTVINAGDRDSAARQQYASQYEQQQHVDSVFSR